MNRLATIGYERETQAQVIDRLKQAGVEVLIDVRAVAASGRAGFSKTLLAASLNEAGIDYLHFRQLGTPKPGRDAAPDRARNRGRLGQARPRCAGRRHEGGRPAGRRL